MLGFFQYVNQCLKFLRRQFCIVYSQLAAHHNDLLYRLREDLHRRTGSPCLSADGKKAGKLQDTDGTEKGGKG